VSLFYQKSAIMFHNSHAPAADAQKRGHRREKRSEILINFEIAFIRETLKYTPSIGIQLSTI
jgi:hypothetical protein